jgi:hypothetical protein
MSESYLCSCRGLRFLKGHEEERREGNDKEDVSLNSSCSPDAAPCGEKKGLLTIRTEAPNEEREADYIPCKSFVSVGHPLIVSMPSNRTW